MEEKDFSTRIVEIAKELQSLVVNSNDGKKRAVIILSSERIDDETSKNNIGIFGHHEQAVSVLHEFAKQSSTKELFMYVAKMVTLENLLKS